MANHLGKTIDTLASSYWFIPGVMSCGALLTAVVLTRSELVHEFELSPLLSWIHHFEPEGARTLMATISGSMITVAGVTFSITISAIAHATSQFGPRLLMNFMQDRGNQVTLGVFIATFLYCLAVLSSITGSSAPGEEKAVHVPYVAVLLGVGFAIASTAVLIYFVHHIPASMHASKVISSVGQALLRDISTTYITAEQAGDPSGEQIAEHAIKGEVVRMRSVRSPFTGYVQFLDTDALCRLAEELDTLLILNARPGDFVSCDDYLAWANTERELDQEAIKRIHSSFLSGDRRTPAQDVLFLGNELVEIATRALSPGINDPFTAMQCIDWLGASFALIAGRHPNRYQVHDAGGNLRVLLPMTSGAEYIRETLGKLGPYVTRDRNSALHAQAMLGRLMVHIGCAEVFTDLQAEAKILYERACVRLDEKDSQLLRERYAILQTITTDSEKNAAICRQHHWLGGSN